MNKPDHTSGRGPISKRAVKQGAVAVFVMLTLGACNTVQGLGQDIESVGRKGEEVIKGE